MTTAKGRTDGLKHGEGSIREFTNPRGELRYQARWWDHSGIQPRQLAKSFTTRDEAEDKLRTVGRAKADGSYASPSEMTISQLVDEYIDRARARITDRTALTYQKRKQTMIDPAIGMRKVVDIKPLDVQRWVDSLGRNAKYKPSTIHAVVAIMMGALREAAVLGVTDRHVGQGVRRPKIQRPETETWTKDEVMRILETVEGDEIYAALYHVAITTGARPGELRALKWDCINFDTGLITIKRTITKGDNGSERIVDRTKSKQTRAIAVVPEVVTLLRWHRARQRERQIAHAAWQNLNVVFDRGDGHWLYQSRWLRDHIVFCEKAGVRRIRHHDIRHTSATLELETGTHIKLVSERLGHSTVSMTLDRYTHPSGSLQRSAAQAFYDQITPKSRSQSGSQPVGDDTVVEGR